MSTMQLHSWPNSSGTRIAWALEELGVAYEYVELDPRQGQHRTPAHLALHPLGKVPVLVDGGRVFFESAAILLHLGATYGVERGLWPPAGGQPHADAICWTVWAATELGAHLLQVLYHGVDTPVSFAPADRSAAAAAYHGGQLQRCFDALDTRLDGRDFIVDRFTLVDIAAAGSLQFGARFGVGPAASTRAAAWLQRCSERPAQAKAR